MSTLAKLFLERRGHFSLMTKREAERRRVFRALIVAIEEIATAVSTELLNLPLYFHSYCSKQDPQQMKSEYISTGLLKTPEME